MKIELLYVRDCPSHRSGVQTVKDVLREYGLSPEIVEIEVADPDQASALRFPGSPTIRVNGKDVEPGIPEAGHYGLICRTYFVRGQRTGLPQRDWIRQAILSAPVEKNEGRETMTTRDNDKEVAR